MIKKVIKLIFWVLKFLVFVFMIDGFFCFFFLIIYIRLLVKKFIFDFVMWFVGYYS